ncbi:hypothetical protein CDFC105_03973 [Clostridioides difficile]|nr:hypothetical protein CDFC105_03973 [Clostridioides difficile]
MSRKAVGVVPGGGVAFFFFQAEDGIRDFCLSRGLGDVYKRQTLISTQRGIFPYVFR